MVKSITPGTVLHAYSEMPLSPKHTHTHTIHNMSHDNPDRRDAEKGFIRLGVKFHVNCTLKVMPFFYTSFYPKLIFRDNYK